MMRLCADDMASANPSAFAAATARSASVWLASSAAASRLRERLGLLVRLLQGRGTGGCLGACSGPRPLGRSWCQVIHDDSSDVGGGGVRHQRRPPPVLACCRFRRARGTRRGRGLLRVRGTAHGTAGVVVLAGRHCEVSPCLAGVALLEGMSQALRSASSRLHELGLQSVRVQGCSVGIAPLSCWGHPSRAAGASQPGMSPGPENVCEASARTAPAAVVVDRHLWQDHLAGGAVDTRKWRASQYGRSAPAFAPLMLDSTCRLKS